jgi:hypothetical protein
MSINFVGWSEREHTNGWRKTHCQRSTLYYHRTGRRGSRGPRKNGNGPRTGRKAKP